MQDTRPNHLPELLEKLISFSLALSYSVLRHCANCMGGGLILRAKDCVSAAEAVPIHSSVTGRRPNLSLSV